MLRLVFMGSDAIALPALDWLAGPGGVAVTAVFTQPDRPAGRGQRVEPNAIKRWATARGLPVHQPERLRDPELEILRAAAPDVVLIMAYGHLLRPAFLDLPRLGTLNLHTSVLPAYRGASPIQTAVAAGERETGVTLMRLVPELDAGPVADVERVPVGPLDTAADIEAALAAACVPLVRRALPALAAGTLAFREQDASRATFCRRLTKEDGALDFARPAAELAARVNGLHPWPGCATEWGGQALKFGLADVAPGDPAGAAPGTVVGADADGLLVACGAGVLRVRRLQRPGGRMLPAGEFLRGCPLPAGTVLPSRPMPALVAPAPFPRAPRR
jgi:methionyl-tRNA formyltransferase